MKKILTLIIITFGFIFCKGQNIGFNKICDYKIFHKEFDIGQVKYFLLKQQDTLLLVRHSKLIKFDILNGKNTDYILSSSIRSRNDKKMIKIPIIGVVHILKNMIYIRNYRTLNIIDFKGNNIGRGYLTGCKTTQNNWQRIFWDGFCGPFDNFCRYQPEIVYSILDKQYIFCSLMIRPHFPINKSAKSAGKQLFQEYDSLCYLPDQPLISMHQHRFHYNPCKSIEDLNTIEKTGNYIQVRNIGRKDSLFMEFYQAQKYFAFNDVAIAADTLNRKLFLSQLITPKIQVFSYEGKLLKEFGKSGKHLSSNDTITYMTKQEFNSFFTKKKESGHKITTELRNLKGWKYNSSLIYDDLYFAPSINKLFRLYYTGIEIDKENYRILYNRDNDSCSKLCSNRPAFLQIYDPAQDYRLIYDEPISPHFKILEVTDDGTIWAVEKIEVGKAIIGNYRLVE